MCSFPLFSPTCFDISSWHFACTKDQVRVLSISVNFCRSYAPFGMLNTENTQFSAFFSYLLWHIELKFCIWLCFTVLQIKFECRQFPSSFVGVMSLLELRILEIHSFPHFFLTRFDILSWNFAFDLVLLYYRSSSSVINFRQFLYELCPFWNLEYWKYSFLHFCLTCFNISSWNIAYDFVLLFQCRQCIWELCPFWNLEYWK